MGTELEKIIGRTLKQGLAVSEQTLFFAESTYGIGPEMLAPSVANDTFEGVDALNELIWTPEPGVRAAVEPALSERGLDTAEIAALTTDLYDAITSIDLIIPAIHTPLPVAVDKGMIALFIEKLYLDRSLDETVTDALAQTFSSSAVIASRVLLRCSGASFGETKRTFMKHFITRCAPYESRFAELFRLVVELLGEIVEDRPVEPYLLKKKRMLVNTLKEIRSFSEKRDHYSMEYLMMQRFKVPPESEDEVLGRLYLLTTVTDVILGLPPDPMVTVREKDFGRFHAGEDFGSLIRTLS